MRLLTALLALIAAPAFGAYGPFSFGNYLSGTLGTGIGEPFTLVVWVKRSAAQWADTSDDRVLCFDDDTTSGANSACIVAGNGTADRVRARIDSTGGTAAFADESFADGTYDDDWVVVVAIYPDEDSRTICIESSSNCTTEGTTRSTSNAFDVLAVGADVDGTLPFAGLIAEVAIFDAVLTSGQIDALQTGADTGPPPCQVRPADCIGYWSLATDQSTHTDGSGNGGPSLSEVSNPTFSMDHPNIVPGAVSSTVRRRRMMMMQ